MLIPLLFYAFVRASYEEYRAGIEPHTASGTAVGVSAPPPSRELEQLEQQFRKTERELRRTAQERDRYRSILADPAAKWRREEEMLRKRCIEVAHELRNFFHASSSSYADRNETVARFKQRHEWKVNELRDELDKQGWLIPQERNTLTFRADDYSHKIEDIARTLASIGMGY